MSRASAALALLFCAAPLWAADEAAPAQPGPAPQGEQAGKPERPNRPERAERAARPALAAYREAAALRAAPAVREMTLARAARQVEGLQKKVTFNLEGATLANVVEWLKEAGCGVILPASLLPPADDKAQPARAPRRNEAMIVQVKDMPLGTVADLFLTAGGYDHSVEIVDVDGKKTAVVAIYQEAGAPGAAFGGMMAAMRQPPMGGMGGERGDRQGRQGGRQGNRGQNQPEPPPPAPAEDF